MLQRVVCGLVVALLILWSSQISPAWAHHEDTAILNEPNTPSIFIEGDEITTKVIFSTGDTVSRSHTFVYQNETAYYLTITDTSADGVTLPPYNQRIDVGLLTQAIHPYSRPLPEGYWTVKVEVRDGAGPGGELLDSEERRLIVKGAEYRVIERQAIAEEENALWSKYNVVFSSIAAIGAAFGGALIGGKISRRAAREQWQETKYEMEKDRKVSEDALKLSQEQMRLDLRPWIGRKDFLDEGVFDSVGDPIPIENVKNLINTGQPVAGITNNFAFILQNYGRLPATNVRLKSQIIFAHQEPLVSTFESLPAGNPFVLMPNEEAPTRSKIPIELRIEQANMPNGRRLFYLCRVDYDYSNGKGVLEVIIEIISDRTLVRHSHVE